MNRAKSVNGFESGHCTAIHGLRLMQTFDVAMQSVFQALNFAKNLGAFVGGQIVKVIQSRRPAFDLMAMTVHDLQFVTLCPVKILYR
jgi:hypothetical protein